jgi:hypothetical protein
VVSPQALNAFLSRPFDKDAGGETDPASSNDQTGDGQTSLNGLERNGTEKSTRQLASVMAGEISVHELLCPHGRLDPGKAAEMKRIDRVCALSPELYSLLVLNEIHAGYIRIVHSSNRCIIRSKVGTERYLPPMC